MHNQNYYCALDNIEVGGNAAQRAADTCCDSFEERKGDSYMNASGEASAKSDIDCKATECNYNDNCRCQAGKISIEGGDACQCEQTECATFNCGCR
jgi:hypothetical protein